MYAHDKPQRGISIIYSISCYYYPLEIPINVGT